MTEASRPPARAQRARDAPQPSLDELVAALSDPAAHPRPVAEVRVLQTHISVLFFAGERVYKLKKPVRLGFLDYSDAPSRKHFCEEEVRLNRRLAPDMYLGVLPVVREPDGRLAIDGEGEPVDWVVAMWRLPAEDMLDARLERGDLEPAQLERIVGTLAAFHRRALTGPIVNRHGLPHAVAGKVRENREELERVARASDAARERIPRRALEFLAADTERRLASLRTPMERRVGDWRVREGHGDLHAGNVCLLDGEVWIYDCVEFSRALRCGDVASDLAFLAMDLDHRGHPRTSRRLLEAYADETSDPELLDVVELYKVHRALIRAKVRLIAAADEELAADEREAAAAEAARYVQLAVGYGLPAGLTLVCGERAGGHPDGPAAYVAGRARGALVRPGAAREAAGRELADRALARGESVVVDVTGSGSDARRPYREVADRRSAPLFAVHLEGRDDGDPLGDLPRDRTAHVDADADPEAVCRAWQACAIAAARTGV